MALKPDQIVEWVIYKITNPKGSAYIGKTSNFKARMCNYKGGSNLHQQKILYNSIKKYGWDAHSVEVLDTFLSNNDFASGKEMFWIRSFMTNLRKWRDNGGMNLTDGGDGCIGAKFENRVSPMKGKKQKESSIEKLKEWRRSNPRPGPMVGKNHSDEAKRKISESKNGKPSPHIGRKHPPEFGIKLSNILKGRPNLKATGRPLWGDDDRKRIGESKIGNTYMKGKKFSDESKLKCKMAKIGKSKPVLQYDLSGNFICEHISKREASRVTGISRSSINEILTGKTKKPNLFIFKYK